MIPGLVSYPSPMYGLRQSGRLANQEVEKVIEKQGYYPSKYTPGLCLHKTRPISLTLVYLLFYSMFLPFDEQLSVVTHSSRREKEENQHQ